MQTVRYHAFGEPEVLRIESVADPEPGPGQVLVQVRSVGLNPVDTYIRSGQYARLPELPHTPGFDASGTVAALGPEADGPVADGLGRPLEIGDRVYLYRPRGGAAAERCVCDPHEVYPLPEGLSFDDGACLGVPYGTAWRSLFQRATMAGRAKPGDTVLVHGATGGVGTAAVQIARQRGLHVLATGGTAQGRDLVLALGAEAVFDHTEDGYAEAIAEATRGRGVGVILEMRADLNLERDLEWLAPGGVVVVIGSRGTIEITPRHMMAKESAVLGMTLLAATPEELREIHTGLGEMLAGSGGSAAAHAVAAGGLAGLAGVTGPGAAVSAASAGEPGLAHPALRPVIHEVLPMAAVAEVHRRVIDQPAAGQFVLSWTA